MSKVTPHHLHFAVVDEILKSQLLKCSSVSQLSLTELTPLFGIFFTLKNKSTERLYSL